MKKLLLIGAVSAALAAPLSFVVAEPRLWAEPVTPADVLPPYEIVASVRDLGLEPTSRPFRRGAYYVVGAADRRGRGWRVVADARSGDILDVVPVRRSGDAPDFGGPRIIDVPPPETDNAAPDDMDADDTDDPQDESAPAPHADTGPRVEAPAPPAYTPPRRDPLTPIYPTPHFTAPPGDKFTMPDESAGH